MLCEYPRFLSVLGSSTLYSHTLPVQILGKLCGGKQPLLKLPMDPRHFESLSAFHQSAATSWTAERTLAYPQQCRKSRGCPFEGLHEQWQHLKSNWLNSAAFSSGLTVKYSGSCFSEISDSPGEHIHAFLQPLCQLKTSSLNYSHQMKSYQTAKRRAIAYYEEVKIS